MAASASQKMSPWVWVAMAVLALVALAVIFVLPRLVEQYELPLVKRVEQAPVVPVLASSVPPAPAISPFEEAQLARQRREAQDVLASLLRQQAELDMYGVREWAAADFDSAIAAARQGDDFYRSGQFADATAAYRTGDEILSMLQEQRLPVYARLLDEGNLALETQDASTALARFRLAGVLQPTSREADLGVQRALVLEQVESLLSEGLQLQQAGDLLAARDRFTEAVGLDSAHLRAASLLSDNAQRRVDAEFNTIMSEGFDLLSRGQPEQAIAAFERALRVKPGSEQATAAITQTREQVTVNLIARYRAEAVAHEAAERWGQAIAAYDAALFLDINLVFAQEGKDYSERRLQLDTLLQINLDNPVRLADAAAYEEALEVFRIGRDLSSDLIREQGAVGPRLQAQLEQTEALLQAMQEPLEIMLISDNATWVTIYRVGELGTFNETSIRLTPGRYVAVGTRPGFRDVREEFVVGFGQQPGPLDIRCNEQVAAVNRR
jgi:tetratricopeptide (TPR) repeat protein